MTPISFWVYWFLLLPIVNEKPMWNRRFSNFFPCNVIAKVLLVFLLPTSLLQRYINIPRMDKATISLNETGQGSIPST